MDFLINYCEENYTKHVFTEGYGEERAFHDGQAKQIENFYKLIKGLTNE